MDREQLDKINSYLIFKLGNEEFAANAGKVLHILELIEITEVPNSPGYMKGVINLRGAVLPVIDTRLKMGMPSTEYTSNTCIIVVESEVEGEIVEVGALVDSVISVAEYDEGDIKAPPVVSKDSKLDLIKGMVEHENKFIMIVDIDKAFSTDEVFDLKSITEKTVRDANEIEE